jgi:serine/tyrosine/threonine adenylyltransferase
MMRFETTGSYTELPERFFQPVPPQPVAAPRLIKLNEPLARELGLDPDWLSGPEGLDALSGSRWPEASNPVALAYAGHQFGHFVPQLGDGRAVLLGELIDRSGRRRDVQLKGSGRTPFSRRGDGRAALGPVLREYVVSEAMAALGIPTTRALAAVLTGEMVQREQRLPGGVFARVAASHIRVGTFQFCASRRDYEGLRLLADHVIARHYPEVAGEPAPHLALLKAVIAAQASLIARWMLVGFIHGVMNTDNMTVSGETIDYGPCAFMDTYDPATVFSSIDEAGRYAYGNQPAMGWWNLARLTETLLPLMSEDRDTAIALAEDALGTFDTQFAASYISGMRAKLGLTSEQPDDMALISGLFDAMQKGAADFTLTFRELSLAADDPSDASAVRAQFVDPGLFDAWAVQWKARIAQEAASPAERGAAMRAVNPRFIPRNHRVEAMIQAAVNEGDFAPFEELLAVVTRPYEEQDALRHYADPPLPHERVLQTFCGT